MENSNTLQMEKTDHSVCTSDAEDGAPLALVGSSKEAPGALWARPL